MDFEKLDTKPIAEHGAEMHVSHPALGHLLYEGEGADPKTGRLIDKSKPHEKVTITVRGYHAPSVQSAAKRSQAKAMNKLSEAESEKMGHDLIDALIVDWSNVSKAGEPLACTRANKIWLAEVNHDLFNQINEFAQDQANFFANASPD
ncbi:MAG: hypothetical protein ACU0CF_04650 [Sagittula sp.]|uniref:hypothetical protein n=1 Tax=Sagittula sp. TaxID=2038081 RepID=UPI004057F1C4